MLHDNRCTHADTAVGITTRRGFAATAINRNKGIVMIGTRHCVPGMHMMPCWLLRGLIMHLARLIKSQYSSQRQHHQHGDEDPV